MYSDVYLDINDLMGTGDIYGSFGSIQRDSKMLMITCIVSCVIMLWTFICLWRVYKKLGLKGWAVLVPFYGPFVLYKRILGSGWLFLLSMIPLVNVVMMFVLYTKMAKIFGKGFLFGISLIFFTPITYPILAFGKAMPVDNMDDCYMDEDQPAELSIVEEPVEQPIESEKSKKRKAPKEKSKKRKAKVEEPIEEVPVEEPVEDVYVEEPIQEVPVEPSIEELVVERKLNKLEELLAEGLITKAQYNRKKREIESSLK